jgi:tetratricopeptide (TPR) repeat protein
VDQQTRGRLGLYAWLLAALAALTLLVAAGPPRVQTVLLYLILVATGLVLSVLLTRAWLRSSPEAVWKSLGVSVEKVHEAQADPHSRSILVLLLLPAVMAVVLISMATWAAVPRLPMRFWPSAPHWIAAPIALALLIMLGAVAWLPISHLLRDLSFKQRVYAIATLTLLAPGVVLLVVVLLSVFALLFAAAGVGRDLLAPFLIWGPMARGDYERALRRLRRLSRRKAETSTLLGLRGGVLLMAGRPTEAEGCYRECALRDHGKSRPVQALELSNLGTALIDQGRYEEARLCIGKAILLDVGTASPYQNMAQLYLVQGIEPEKALRFTDMAIEAPAPAPPKPLRPLSAGESSAYFKRSLPLVQAQDTRRYSGGELFADKAWALALLGRHSEAEEAAQRALQESDPRFLPVHAGIEWRLGMALLSMGRPSQATDRFRHAREIDPSGKYGSLAARALAGHGLPATDPPSDPPPHPV